MVDFSLFMVDFRYVRLHSNVFLQEYIQLVRSYITMEKDIFLPDFFLDHSYFRELDEAFANDQELSQKLLSEASEIYNELNSEAENDDNTNGLVRVIPITKKQNLTINELPAVQNWNDHHYSLSPPETAVSSSITTHTGKKYHLCTVCKKAFTARGMLDDHLLTHSGGIQHQCTQCNKVFASKNSLNLHLVRHTGQKPHVCNVCDKAFARKGDLNRHVWTHSDEKPLRCTFCNKGFIEKVKLKMHLLTHATDKPIFM